MPSIGAAAVCARSVRKTALNVIVATAMLGTSACSDSDSGGFVPEADPNLSIPDAVDSSIYQNLGERPDYQVLRTLIEDSDLVSAMQNDNAGQGWTLFAPSDEAFANEQFEALTVEQKNQLIRNHLYSGRLPSADLSPGVLSMSAGSVEVAIEDDSVRVGGALIVARDRVMNNGIIHFVDSMLELL